MGTNKQILHPATDSDIPPIKFWGNIAFAALGMLANMLLLRTTFQLPETTISYLVKALHTLVILAGSLVILLTIRGRQKMGAQVAFFTVALLFAYGSFLYAESPITATFSLITIATIIISQLLPKELRRQSIAVTGIALMIIWVAAWSNPSWRLPPRTVSAAGLVASTLFALILAGLVIRQAWGGNFRVKLVTSFTTIALISVAIVGTVGYISYRNRVREDFRQRLLDIVSLVAKNQDGDLHATIHGPENAKDESHLKILAQNVQYLAMDPDLKYIYTMRKNEQGQIYFVINARQGGQPGDPIGTVYNEPSKLLATQFDTLSKPVVEEDLYTDVYGQVLASYAPFYRSDGTREGIIGVDIDAEKVLAAERAVLYQVLGITLATMILVTLFGVWLGGVFVRPVVNLSHTAQKIIEGDLNARAKPETNDEVGDLANAFNQMTSQLQETLQRAEQRVAERTRNLELAAEVGHAVSQVRDLDVMLKDACELILKEFDLYYVQVYLTSANQKYLNLKAGTGEVGAQLVMREHSLLFDVNSINGRSAVEKRSVVISDTAKSAAFRRNLLLPETRGEMAVPLIVAETVVGVLDMQSKEPGVLNEEVLPAFEALAGQLAVAIQNATLLEEANRARGEVEKQARLLVRQSWDDYMDAIHTPEWIGFKFNQREVLPLVSSHESRASDNAISSPISITGEAVGSLIVEMLDSSDKDQAVALIDIAVQQMARQIENLHLLESAERYRQKAELAVRRTVLDGWKQFMEIRPKGKLAFRYDTSKVQPISHDPKAASLTIPIKTRDQAIGKISILDLEEPDSASLEIVNSVMERLGNHIESLRQYDQTQSALAQSRKLFDASRNLTQAADLQELLLATTRTLDISDVNRALLTTFAYDSENEIEQLTVVANWWNGEGHEVTAVGTRYSQEMIQLLPMFVNPTPVFFDDTFTDERVDEKTREFAKQLNLRAVAVLPLHLGSRQIGALFLEAENPHYFTPEETRLFISLAPQIAAVLETRQQYEKAQRQAEREAMLNAINQKIQSATSVETVLQIAARELGRALDASKAVAQLGMNLKTRDHGNNHHGQKP